MYVATYVHNIYYTYVYTMSCFITGIPRMVPHVTVDNSTKGRNLTTITLSWGEPFNNFDPIVNYTVSCLGDVTCPPNSLQPQEVILSLT